MKNDEQTKSMQKKLKRDTNTHKKHKKVSYLATLLIFMLWYLCELCILLNNPGIWQGYEEHNYTFKDANKFK